MRELRAAIQVVVAVGEVGLAIAVGIDAEAVQVGLREIRPAAVAAARREVDAAGEGDADAAGQAAKPAFVPAHAEGGRIFHVLMAQAPALVELVVLLATGGPRSVGEGDGLEIRVLGADADEAAVEVPAPGGADCRLPALAVRREARRDIEPEAVEVLAQDDVDHARDRIRAVDGRSAVEQLVVLVHQEPGNDAEVRRGRHALHAGRRDAPAVQQHQRALRPKTAQIGGDGARPVVEHEAVEREVHLRASRGGGFLQDVASVDEASFALHLGGDDLQRRDAVVGVSTQPRTRDHDFLDRPRVLLLLGLFFGLRLVVGFLCRDGQVNQAGERQAQQRLDAGNGIGR